MGDAAVVVSADDVIVQGNTRWKVLLPADSLGRALLEVLPSLWVSETAAVLDRIRDPAFGADPGPGIAVDTVPVRLDGAPLNRLGFELSAGLLPRIAPGTAVLMFRDVSHWLGEERALRHRATHDALTGLPNRWLFDDHLARALAFARRRATQVAVAVVDIDYFKRINDVYGHVVGDAVLQTVAQRMSARMRAEDMVCRLGGDEFALVLSSIGSREAAGAALEAILRVICEAPIQIRDVVVVVTCSAGVSVFPMDGDNERDALATADEALYRAKRRGRNQVQSFVALSSTQVQ
jgi:diguanylate cyclase (GGDEF)-like protein